MIIVWWEHHKKLPGKCPSVCDSSPMKCWSFCHKLKLNCLDFSFWLFWIWFGTVNLVLTMLKKCTHLNENVFYLKLQPFIQRQKLCLIRRHPIYWPAPSLIPQAWTINKVIWSIRYIIIMNSKFAITETASILQSSSLFVDSISLWISESFTSQPTSGN